MDKRISLLKGRVETRLPNQPILIDCALGACTDVRFIHRGRCVYMSLLGWCGVGAYILGGAVIFVL